VGHTIMPPVDTHNLGSRGIGLAVGELHEDRR
jgi:hypothetical protein